MSDETPYTPSTTMVRLSYIASTKEDGDPDWTREGAKAEFTRWLDGEKAKAVADAEAQQAQIAAQEPAGATQGGSGDSRASGGLDGAAADTCGAKSEPFLIRDSDQKPVHYLVKTCHLPAGHGRPHHWPVLTFVTPGFTEDAP